MRRCLRDRSGVVAILAGFLIIPLVGGMALAVDASIAFMVESRLSKALDAAALAAGQALDAVTAEELALAYFDANFDTAGGLVEVGELDFEFDAEAHEVTMTADATVKTYFARVIGFDTLPVQARTVVQQSIGGLEIALVLDVTLSMDGTKFTQMKAAALDLADILFPDGEATKGVYMSVVPFNAAVNAGSEYTAWLKTGDNAIANPSLWAADVLGWKGCMEARVYPLDAGDVPPTEAPFTSYYYAPTPSDTNDNNFPPVKGENAYKTSARGPNLGCPTPIEPLTNSYNSVVAALNGVERWARGGTTSNVGLVWGWRTISPRWRGLWGGETPASRPLDYGRRKAVVILTDGDNMLHDNSKTAGTPNSDYTAYRRVDDAEMLNTSSSNTAKGKLDARMLETCALMKDVGIQIFTISYGTGTGSDTQTMLRSCATEPSMYFHAPTGAVLSQAFETIAVSLTVLRIKE